MNAPDETEVQAEHDTSVELTRRSQRLFRLGIGAALLMIGYCVYNNDVADVLHLYLGILIVALAWLPALKWAQQGNFQFPVFEVFMLSTMGTYALPLLNGNSQLAHYSPETISLAAIAVIVFQLTAQLVFYRTPARPGRSTFWRMELISDRALVFLRVGVVLCTLYTYLSQFTDMVPYDLAGPLRAIFFGLGIVSSFVMSRLWGQGTLLSGDRLLLTVMLAMQLYLSISSLVMIAGMSTLLLAILGYVSGSHKLPLVVLVPSILFFGLLHNGKSYMREKYWDEQQNHQVSLGELPAFYAEWFAAGLQGGSGQSAPTSKLIDRASLFHIVCLVVDATPDRRPYLNGYTYSFIPAQFIPRFFWPDKPVAHIATNTIGIYYGLIDEESTLKTTIAIGLLAEAYANFGFLGAALIGAFMGLFFRKITGWASESPMFSPGGLLLVVLMAWSFQSEFTLSIWLSSLFQAVVAVVAAPLAIRKLISP